MPKGTNRTKRIRETIASLFETQAKWDSRRLRKSCLDAIGGGNAIERARLGNSIRRTLTQLLESGVLVMGEGEEISAGPAFQALLPEGIDPPSPSNETQEPELSKIAPKKDSEAKKPKEKDMRRFLDELFKSGAHSEDEIVRAAVERFEVKGERVHGVRGLALQVLKASVAEGALACADGVYRMGEPSETPKPASDKIAAAPKRTTAVKVQRASRIKPRAAAPLRGDVTLDEKSFAMLINAEGGAFFNVFVAKLLESHYASAGIRVSGRFVVDGSEDKGIDVVFHTRDELGFTDKTAVQAKTRARSQITLKELREFYGCMHAEGATKGVFITTSTFTTEAVEFLAKSPDLVGIDLVKLFELACRYGIGIRDKDGKPYAAVELISL